MYQFEINFIVNNIKSLSSYKNAENISKTDKVHNKEKFFIKKYANFYNFT